MNPKIDDYLAEPRRWQAEMGKLRKIILKYPLVEEMKWGKPCYSFAESNLLILQPFKDYCALMFCKGALLQDPHALLKKPGESTQAGRQLRFTSAAEIGAKQAIVQAYIEEAIEAQKAGRQLEFKVNPEPMPEELQKRLQASPPLKHAFEALTPGRQRGYILHFLAAKQSKTREARIDKCAPLILRGKGLLDGRIPNSASTRQ